MSGGFFSRLLRKSVSTAALLSNSEQSPKYNTWDARQACERGFKASTWVYACVNLRLKAVASVPWRVQVMRGGEWVNEPNHKLQRLIDSPNPEMDRAEMFRLMMAHLDLAGNAYWTKVRGGLDDLPIALYPVPPAGIRIGVDKSNNLLRGFYVYEGNGVRKTIPPQDIIHFSYVNPESWQYGFAPMQAAGRSVDVDNGAADWQKVSLNNRGVPDGVFSIDGDDNMSAEDFDQIRKVIREQYAGANNARLPWVVKGAKWTPMGLTAAELDYINSRKFTREEIAAAFSVPPPMIGIYDNATLSNIETARQIFWRDTIVPILDELESHLNLSLVREFGTSEEIRLVYDTTGVQALQENLTEKMTVASALWAMGVPFNEINRRLKLGFDDIEGGDQGYIQAGLVPAGFDFDMEAETISAAKAREIGYGITSKA